MLLRKSAQAPAAVGDCPRSKRSKLARSSGSELAIGMRQLGMCKPAGAGATASTSGTRMAETRSQVVMRAVSGMAAGTSGSAAVAGKAGS